MKKNTLIILFAFMFATLWSISQVCAKELVLSVIDISTDDSAIYAVYWPKNSGLVKLERAGLNQSNWETLVETDLNFYIDKTAKKGELYSYKLQIDGGELIAASNIETSGKPIISDIRIDSGASNKEGASVVVNFKTDKLAQGQVFYGESLGYQNNTELSGYLNQSHTILLEKLTPGMVYHIKLMAVDKNGQNTTESPDQTFTAPMPPVDQTILEIIIQALSRAFSNFEKWFNS